MRMDDAAKKWAKENGVNYTSYDGNNDAASQLEQVRRQIPSLKNVREDVYRLESRRMQVYPEVM